jgi:hypothetical protein
MKLGFFLCAFLCINVSFADCYSSLETAQEKTNKANGLLSLHNSDYATFDQLAREGASKQLICDAGKKADLEAYFAAINFRAARDSYNEAILNINDCSKSTAEEAARNSDIVTNSYDILTQTIAKLDTVLYKNCGFKPLTPMLNQ